MLQVEGKAVKAMADADSVLLSTQGCEILAKILTVTYQLIETLVLEISKVANKPFAIYLTYSTKSLCIPEGAINRVEAASDEIIEKASLDLAFCPIKLEDIRSSLKIKTLTTRDSIAIGIILRYIFRIIIGRYPLNPRDTEGGVLINNVSYNTRAIKSEVSSILAVACERCWWLQSERIKEWLNSLENVETNKEYFSDSEESDVALFSE